MTADGVILRGRFLLDAVPVPSPIAKAGHLYQWRATDLDGDLDGEGLAADLPTAWTTAVTHVASVGAA